MELICIIVRKYVFVRHGLKGKAHIRNKYLGLLREKHRKEKDVQETQYIPAYKRDTRSIARSYKKRARNSDAREILDYLNDLNKLLHKYVIVS
jgi:hypothetical protein